MAEIASTFTMRKHLQIKSNSMSGILFIPLGDKPLSSGLLICNCATGEIFEILQVDGYSLKMKSLSHNSISTMATNQMNPEDWVICSIE